MAKRESLYWVPTDIYQNAIDAISGLDKLASNPGNAQSDNRSSDVSILFPALEQAAEILDRDVFRGKELRDVTTGIIPLKEGSVQFLGFVPRTSGHTEVRIRTRFNGTDAQKDTDLVLGGYMGRSGRAVATANSLQLNNLQVGAPVDRYFADLVKFGKAVLPQVYK